MKKKILMIILAISLLTCNLGVHVTAETDEVLNKAQALKSLGLFIGTESGFELEREMTRMESIVMLVRMLGKEAEAFSEDKGHPFTDIPDWENAEKYISYAYNNNLIYGVSEDKFDPDSKITCQMYATIMLRALNYTDTEQATIWDNWDTVSQSASLIPDNVNRNELKRGDIVLISYNGLFCSLNNSEKTLAGKLIEEGVFSDLSFSISEIIAGKKVDENSPLELIAGKIYMGVPAFNANVLMKTEITQENSAYYLGVDNIDFSQAIAYEGMMSQAHSVCLVKLNEGVDVEKAKKEIKENVNPRKWVCVAVEDENVRVENVGNIIALVMDNNYPTSLMSDFLSITGQKLVANEKNIYNIDGYLAEAGKAIDQNAVDNFINKLNTIKNDYLQNAKSINYSIIPEKGYFFRDRIENYTDYETIAGKLRENLNGIKEINIANLMSADDFYKTDIHWKQERLFDIVNTIGEQLDFFVDQYSFEEKTFDDFKGSYYTMAENSTPEKLTWLTNESLEKIVVSYFENNSFTGIYDEKRLQSNSQFDMFLAGAMPVATLENPEYEGTKELVIFRDSFASNLVPLFADQYSKITLVDLRYMFTSLLPQYVSFEGADVLFLYSTQIINNSYLLK